MEPLALVADKVKSFAKSGEDFFSRLVAHHENSSRRNPIEILKRLQREAFSDLMKLRDRQDKTEKLLTFYRTSKGGPFQEDATRVKGQVDLLGALLLVDDLHPDELSRAGIRTGMRSRITFETTINQRDTLEMELVTSQKKHGFFDDVLADALSISKVCYTANVTDWLSLVALPIGAHCKDVAVRTSSCQAKGLSDYSSSGPPLMSLQNGSAIGLMARKRNIVASLAQFDSGLGTYANPTGSGNWLSTFGQIVCQLPKSTKLSLIGLRQVPKSTQHRNAGPFTIPLSILKHRKRLDEPIPDSDLPVALSSESSVSTGSVAVMLETELDDFTRLHGWVQTNPGCVQWAVGLLDSPEDETGWGVSVGGMAQGPGNQDHYQVEAFLKLKLANKFTLQPGLMYMMDGSNRMPAVTFRSTWSI